MGAVSLPTWQMCSRHHQADHSCHDRQQNNPGNGLNGNNRVAARNFCARRELKARGHCQIHVAFLNSKYVAVALHATAMQNLDTCSLLGFHGVRFRSKTA